MSHDPGLTPDRQRQLDHVISQCLAAIRAGIPPDREALLDRYPALADHLRTFFAAQDAETPGDAPHGGDQLVIVDAAVIGAVTARSSVRPSPVSSRRPGEDRSPRGGDVGPSGRRTDCGLGVGRGARGDARSGAGVTKRSIDDIAYPRIMSMPGVQEER